MMCLLVGALDRAKAAPLGVRLIISAEHRRSVVQRTMSTLLANRVALSLFARLSCRALHRRDTAASTTFPTARQSRLGHRAA